MNERKLSIHFVFDLVIFYRLIFFNTFFKRVLPEILFFVGVITSRCARDFEKNFGRKNGICQKINR